MLHAAVLDDRVKNRRETTTANDGNYAAAQAA